MQSMPLECARPDMLESVRLPRRLRTARRKGLVRLPRVLSTQLFAGVTGMLCALRSSSFVGLSLPEWPAGLPRRTHPGRAVDARRSSGRRSGQLARRAVKYGTKQYWDDMYRGTGELPSSEYSWYCDWDRLEPFWSELVPDSASHVLLPGIGNDPILCDMYDDGWRSITAFDYSADAVKRAHELVGSRPIELLCADARELPLGSGGVDAVLDKGALDAVDLAPERDSLARAAAELARVLRPGGVLVSVSRTLALAEWQEVMPRALWEQLRDGECYINEDGEATIGLGAKLFAWRRRAAAHTAA